MSNPLPQKNHAKVITIVLTVFILFAAATLYPMIKRATTKHDVKIDGVYLSKSRPVDDFLLLTTKGGKLNKNSLQGHWTMLFFGFTNCGMVCPMTMTELRGMYSTLQAELTPDQLPQVVMVSVDPERDSLQKLNDYVTTFNPGFLGARAEMDEIMRIEKQFKLLSIKIEGSGKSKNQYTINHSAEIILINPQGELQAFLAYPHKADQMARDYEAILNNHSA
jgi:protein SCO1/2